MDKRKGRRIVTSVSNEALEVSVRSPLTLDEMFDVFIAAKKSEGRSPRTIADHVKHYRYFRDWLRTIHRVVYSPEIDADIIRQWISYMLNEKVTYDGHPTSKPGEVGLQPMTVNIRLRSIKCFFRFLKDEGYIQVNPTERVSLLRTPDEGVQTLTTQQILILLNVCDVNTYTGLRDRALMTLLLDTGLRISEALSLTIDDVDLYRQVITVSGHAAKTRKFRQVPISKQTTKLLRKLVSEVQHNFPEQSRLFVSNYGEEMLASSFRQRLLNYAKQCGIRGVRVSPHTFRHTFAKMYIKNGGDPFSLQAILGHTTLDMVRHYVNLFSSDVQEQHRKFSPVETL